MNNDQVLLNQLRIEVQKLKEENAAVQRKLLALNRFINASPGTDVETLFSDVFNNSVLFKDSTGDFTGIYTTEDGSPLVATSGGGDIAFGSMNGTYIDDATIAYTKMESLAANTVLGSVAGGAPEEITCTSAGRSLISQTTAADQLTALSLTQHYDVFAVCFHAAAATASADLGAHPSTSQFLCNNNRNIQLIPLGDVTDVRIVARVTTASTSANNPRVRVRFKTTFSTTVADYSDIGSSEVAASVASTGIADSDWVALNDGAKTDVYVCIDQIGGDSAQTPAIGQLQVYFRRQVYG